MVSKIMTAAGLAGCLYAADQLQTKISRRKAIDNLIEKNLKIRVDYVSPNERDVEITPRSNSYQNCPSISLCTIHVVRTRFNIFDRLTWGQLFNKTTVVKYTAEDLTPLTDYLERSLQREFSVPPGDSAKELQRRAKEIRLKQNV